MTRSGRCCAGRAPAPGTTSSSTIPASDGELVIDAGVEVPDGFTARDAVRPVETPAGEAAAVTHYGDYADLAGAYAALEQWCTASGRRPAGTSWEVYGDWEEDPAKRRTDVYFLL